MIAYSYARRCQTGRSCIRRMLSFHACQGCVSCAVVLVEMSEVEDRKTGRRGR